MMDSQNEFPGHASAVFVLLALGYVQVFIRKLLDCKRKMQKKRFLAVFDEMVTGLA
jgi:hypothetical protein